MYAAEPDALGTRLSIRDAGEGNSKLSTGSIIAIVVVCACVGLLVLTLFLWRLIVRHCRSSNPAPLPPVQELAHRREAHLAAFTQQQSMSTRHSSWLDSSLASRRSQALFQANSATSLLPGTPKRKSSLHTDEGTTSESVSPMPSSVSIEETSLHPPNPAFFGGSWDPANSPHDSFISTTSLSASTSTLATSPSSSVPFSETSSSGSHITATGNGQLSPRSTPSLPRPSRSRPNFRPDAHSRQSTTSSIGSSHTPRGSIIRGAPHSPHSNIQIVLPAPLRSQDSYFPEGYSDQQSPRTSMLTDQWVTAGLRHQSVDGGERRRSSGEQRKDQRPFSQPARGSIVRRSPSADLPASPAGQAQRSLSQPRFAQARQHAYASPPVPRIPEVYDYDEVDATLSERGRSVQPKSTTISVLQSYNTGQEHPPLSQITPHNRLHKPQSSV